MRTGDLSARTVTIAGATGTQAMIIQGTTGQSGEIVQVQTPAGTVMGVGPYNQPTRGLAWPATGGRLTLTSGVPLTTADVLAATNIYYTPYNGTGQIRVWNSIQSYYEVLAFSEISYPLGGLTANTNYDIFLWNSGNGNAQLQIKSWSDNTTRAFTLTDAGGYIYSTGSQNQRYLGTIRITGTTGQCEDSAAKRYVWNRYNQVPRILYQEYSPGVTWTWVVSAVPNVLGRPCGDTGFAGTVHSRVEFVIGADTLVQATLSGFAAASSGAAAYIGLVLDPSGGSPSAGWNANQEWGYTSYANAFSLITRLCVHFTTNVGYHNYTGVEGATGTGTCTFWPVILEGWLMG